MIARTFVQSALPKVPTFWLCDYLLFHYLVDFKGSRNLPSKQLTISLLSISSQSTRHPKRCPATAPHHLTLYLNVIQYYTFGFFLSITINHFASFLAIIWCRLSVIDFSFLLLWKYIDFVTCFEISKPFLSFEIHQKMNNKMSHKRIDCWMTFICYHFDRNANSKYKHRWHSEE